MMFRAKLKNYAIHFRGQRCFEGMQPGESLGVSHARRLARCVFDEGVSGRPPTANTYTSKDTRRGANPSYTALAACRITLAGAAETGAGSRHASFDPICWMQVLGDTETGAAVTQTNPVDL